MGLFLGGRRESGRFFRPCFPQGIGIQGWQCGIGRKKRKRSRADPRAGVNSGSEPGRPFPTCGIWGFRVPPCCQPQFGVGFGQPRAPVTPNPPGRCQPRSPRGVSSPARANICGFLGTNRAEKSPCRPWGFGNSPLSLLGWLWGAQVSARAVPSSLPGKSGQKKWNYPFPAFFQLPGRPSLRDVGAPLDPPLRTLKKILFHWFFNSSSCSTRDGRPRAGGAPVHPMLFVLKTGVGKWQNPDFPPQAGGGGSDLSAPGRLCKAGEWKMENGKWRMENRPWPKEQARLRLPRLELLPP